MQLSQVLHAMLVLTLMMMQCMIICLQDKSNGNQGGPTQRASALAALSSAFNPSGKSSHLDRSNGSSQGGPTQRASALAALSSAFNSSPGSKTTAPRPSGIGQGSQRAAAFAALSSVLTAEKKTPETSPSRSPRSETNLPTEGKSETQSEVEGSEGVAEVKEMEETASAPGSNGEDSERKQDTEQEENDDGNGQSTFSYDQLKAHSDNPVKGIDFKRREAYLSDEEFQTVFGVTKEAFYKMPKWKQDMQKKKFDLF